MDVRDGDETKVEPMHEYVAVLRCQTWNVWPERSGVEEHPFPVGDGRGGVLHARLVVLSYEQRPIPHYFDDKETKAGGLLWDGRTPGHLNLRDAILKCPEDRIELSFQHRYARHGEVDVCLNFKCQGDPSPETVDSLRATTHAVISLINLSLHEYLVPAAPFQLLKVEPDGKSSLSSSIQIQVTRPRREYPEQELQAAVSSIAHALRSSRFGPKLVTALELYAAHFSEAQARVRFLLLVVAIESLCTPTRKHEVSVDLLTRWQAELGAEMEALERSTEEWLSLDALKRELGFRSDDSIRSQFRKLFASLPGVPAEESKDLQRRALHVYDKRSTLVHEGELPSEELVGLEKEACLLLEKVFAETLASTAEVPGGG
ncbi:HEPN domain-containing protein [Paucibacter sp. R3-3]|uniref:HEPN domain-containing protein n=1 Tax=Roseateles agri TaxID=3098619 RepID=A0ABU5DI44_9BURK|nr:HEPN domain-containing protein [Paucibacter sp. R3-3]MDY0744792.1 HEPN domain-containing protein [Paucibacter sp. R3-3]